MTDNMKPAQNHRLYSRTSPLSLFFFLLIIVFAIEFLIMVLLPILLPNAGEIASSFIDSMTLAIFIAPFVWLFFVRPLRTMAITENAKAEAMLECVVDGVVIFNGYGIITSFNPAAEKMFGYASGEMTGRHVRALIPGTESPTAGQSAPDLLSLAQETGGYRCHEMEGRRKDGSSFPMDISISKARLDGQMLFIAILRDVAELKRMNYLLEEQKEFSQRLIQGSAAPTFVIDSGHRVILWNRACEELTGIKAADIIGSDEQWRAFYDHRRPVLADIILDEKEGDLSLLYGTYARSKFIPDGLEAERWYPNIKGTERYIFFNAAPIRNSKGETIAAIETIEDLTEIKLAGNRLKESEEKLRTITSTATDAIILVDNDAKILYWNSAAEKMMGYGSEEAMGRNIDIIVPPGYLEAHKKAFARFAERGQGRFVGKVYEVSALRKDGTEFPVELSISGFQLKGKWHSAGVVRDITERRSLELQLRHAQKMEAVGTLAGGIAHDFNNILTTIIGFGTLLQMKMAKDDPQISRVHTILAAADRAAALTKSLLAFSRKGTIETRPVNLNEIVARVDRIFIRLLGEDIELRSSLSADVLTIMADPAQMEQVLMNLATNARDAMPKGGVLRIDTGIAELDREFIKVHGYGETGRYALLTFHDNGSGMDKETAQRIFDPFFTTKEVGKGTGLGLAIAYGIIKQHKGYINCYSEPGIGTTFRIYLPLAGAAAMKETAAVETELVGGTETILLAEDDADARSLNRQVLENFGYTVVEAVDGADAVTKFMENKERIRLVFLDVIMPKKNGREAYEEIRKLRPDMKALFTSGYAADIFDEREWEEVDFIPKPIMPTMLLKKLREILDT